MLVLLMAYIWENMFLLFVFPFMLLTCAYGFCDSDDKFPDYKVRIKIIFNVIHVKRL